MHVTLETTQQQQQLYKAMQSHRQRKRIQMIMSFGNFQKPEQLLCSFDLCRYSLSKLVLKFTLF